MGADDRELLLGLLQQIAEGILRQPLDAALMEPEVQVRWATDVLARLREGSPQ